MCIRDSFQATYFNERGFTTHETASVRDTLIRKAVEHNGMTTLDDSLLEQFSKEPCFHIQNATYWYQNQHAGETAIRDLVVSNAPREGAKNFDPLFVAFCKGYQEELQKRHVEIIPGKKANLTPSERTQLTKAVTPVSYTHLDVYKRQMPFSRQRIETPFGNTSTARLLPIPVAMNFSSIRSTALGTAGCATSSSTPKSSTWMAIETRMGDTIPVQTI